MQFSDTTNNTGLIQQCEMRIFGDNGFTQISGNTSRLQMFTNLLNRAYERYFEISLRADGKWEFDDSNASDFPIATTGLTSGQQDYAFATDMIRVKGVEIKDESGEWQVLKPIDLSDIHDSGSGYSEFNENGGIPRYYDKVGNSIFLFPEPNYTQGASLKVFYSRPPALFDTADTTETPGFTSLHHDYLVVRACYEYASMRSLARQVEPLFQSATEFEQVIIPEFYRDRDEDAPLVMRARSRSAR